MRKIIVIEGVDGSGKETQTTMLKDRLERLGREVKGISFPNYESSSSFYIKEYLSGNLDMSMGVDDVYKVSLLFAMDRFITLGGLDLDCDYLVFDRYVTSNMVHQGCKFDSISSCIEYSEWLRDLEYVKCGVPEPDIVIYLDVGEAYMGNISGRKNKITGGDTLDIHESDRDYLSKSSIYGRALAEHYGWLIIDCLDSTGLRSIESIHNEIIEKLELEMGVL